jgi:hypothetical protein
MIETFQEIIQRLATHKASSSIRHEDIKADFSNFYMEFQAKCSDMSRSKMDDKRNNL